MKMATLPCINVDTLTVIVQQNHFPNKQTPHKRMLLKTFMEWSVQCSMYNGAGLKEKTLGTNEASSSSS